jgi:hypothetical protein
MSDYVLESNPALERLIERLHAPGEPSPPEESSVSKEHGKRFRRARRSKGEEADRQELLGVDSPAAGAWDRADQGPNSPAGIFQEEPAVDESVWTIHEDPEPPDEMLLVDFNEEPEVFDEIPEEDDGDPDEADDLDEVLDIYEDEEWDFDTILDEDAESLDEDGNEDGDWIFEAFEAWRLEYDDRLVDSSTTRS